MVKHRKWIKLSSFGKEVKLWALPLLFLLLRKISAWIDSTFQQTFPNPVKTGANVLTSLHLVWTSYLLRYYLQVCHVFGDCYMLRMHISFCLTFRCSLHYLQCGSRSERTLPMWYDSFIMWLFPLWHDRGPTLLIKFHQHDQLSFLISSKRKHSLILQTKITESRDLFFINICSYLSPGNMKSVEVFKIYFFQRDIVRTNSTM